MSKPDWKDAPEWAQWLAMDRDGLWFWHADLPALGDVEWISEGQVEGADPVLPHWEFTREARP